MFVILQWVRSLIVCSLNAQRQDFLSTYPPKCVFGYSFLDDLSDFQLLPNTTKASLHGDAACRQIVALGDGGAVPSMYTLIIQTLEMIILIIPTSVTIIILITLAHLYEMIGDWGEIVDAGDPLSGDLFRFRFVFAPCVRPSGRGVAEWAWERAVLLNAGPQNAEKCGSSRGGFFCLFAIGYIAFLIFSLVLLLCSLLF